MNIKDIFSGDKLPFTGKNGMTYKLEIPIKERPETHRLRVWVQYCSSYGRRDYYLYIDELRVVPSPFGFELEWGAGVHKKIFLMKAMSNRCTESEYSAACEMAEICAPDAIRRLCADLKLDFENMEVKKAKKNTRVTRIYESMFTEYPFFREIAKELKAKGKTI